MKDIGIRGLQKTTLLDYPGHVAATIFLGGCNYRCPFCHNSELLETNAPADFTAQEILSFLKKRAGILEGVCITGGEPTLQPEALKAFISQIRDLGLLVKLDTNGSHPEVLKSLVQQGLLDYIAVDIKSAPMHYPVTCGVAEPHVENVKETVSFLRNDLIPYEFRTTCVKGLHTLEDFQQIGPWITGCHHYFLQNYVASDLVLSPDGYSSFTGQELAVFARAVQPYVDQVQLRGIDYPVDL